MPDHMEEIDGQRQPPSRQPSFAFTATPRTRDASPPQVSRFSSSTLSSIAPSLPATPSHAARKSFPNAYENVSFAPRSSRHDRNRSVPSAWRPPPTSSNPSRTPSQISVARSLSASSREIPIMLQIDEEAPPVPPLPDARSQLPLPSPYSDVSLSSPVNASTKAPNHDVAEPVFRTVNIPLSPRADSGPQSAPLTGPSSGPRGLRSKYYREESISRTRSAATSQIPSPVMSHPPVFSPPPSKMKPVTGPPPAFKPPRQASPARANSHSGSRPASAASHSSSFMNRLGYLKKSLRDPARYHKLDEEQEREIPLNQMRESQMTEEASDGEFIPIAFDISTFEGPAHFQTKPSISQRKRRKLSVEGVEKDHDKLESQGQLTGGLGVGMEEVVEAQVTMPPNYKPSIRVTPNYKPSLAKRTVSRWRRQPPRSPPNPVTQAGQEAAEKSGQVVAVDEEFVDLSNIEGGMGGGGDTPKDIDRLADEAVKQSFYFPPDPQMPNWRPLPMQPWYLILLMCIAITLFGVSEHLVQASQTKGLIEFHDPSEVSNGLWFVWKYLGEILLVSYGVMFQATDFEVRRLEPYYQMSRPTGAIAPESLNMDYLTFWSYLIPFKAFRHRQWAVVCSSLSTIMASAILPVLYSAAVNLNPPRDERTVKKGQPPILYMVQMDPRWGRVMEAFLLLIFIASGLLLFQQRRKSGLTGDLKGIAGIATMATKSHVLNDFKGLDLASHQTIHKQLAHRRFILHKGSLWQGEWITRKGDEDQDVPKPKNPHPVALHLPVGMIFMLGLVTFSALIPVFEFNESANKVTDFAPWFLPLLATLIKLVWTNLETGVRMIEPFYHLSKRHQPPSVLLLDYTGTIPGVMPVKAFFNQHFLLGAIGIGSLLGEVLTVCVSSFNVDGQDFLSGAQKQMNSSGETKRTFFTSLAIAETIPVVMLCVLIFVLIFRRHAFLPRQPGTIASVLAFVHQSRMLYDFVAEENDDDDNRPTPTAYRNARKDTFTPKAMSKSKTIATALASEKDVEFGIAERAVAKMQTRGKTYGLGWYRGRDGQDHVGVDEEELLHGYEHGVDFSKSHMGAADIGRWEHL